MSVPRGRDTELARLILAAALAQGVGRPTETERCDLLMRESPADLFVAAKELLGDRSGVLAETVAALHTQSHPNCYMRSTEFGETLGLSPVKSDCRRWSWRPWLVLGALLSVLVVVIATR
jgi:hypothetical protein